MFTNPWWRRVHHSLPNFSKLIKNGIELILLISSSPPPSLSLSSLSWLTFGKFCYSPLSIWSTRCFLRSHMNIFSFSHELLLSYHHQASHGLAIYRAAILNINISVRVYKQSYNLLASLSLFPFPAETQPPADNEHRWVMGAQLWGGIA